MQWSVKTVIPNENFTLSIVFESGEEGVLDMKPYLNFGAFQRIKDYSQFRRVRVAFGAVEWEAGVDLDPEFVYAKCKLAAPA